MPLETTLTIAGLVEDNPAGPDDISQGDNHLRLLKAVLKNIFPGGGGSGFSTIIASTEAEINFLQNARSNIQAQIDALESRISDNEDAIADLYNLIAALDARITALENVVDRNGLWVNTTNYLIGDIVSEANDTDCIYIALTDNLNKLPSANGTDWAAICISDGGGRAGNLWIATTSYLTGDMVTEANDTDCIYLALTDNLNKLPSANDTDWSAFCKADDNDLCLAGQSSMTETFNPVSIDHPPRNWVVTNGAPADVYVDNNLKLLNVTIPGSTTTTLQWRHKLNVEFDSVLQRLMFPLDDVANLKVTIQFRTEDDAAGVRLEIYDILWLSAALDDFEAYLDGSKLDTGVWTSAGIDLYTEAVHGPTLNPFGIGVYDLGTSVSSGIVTDATNIGWNIGTLNMTAGEPFNMLCELIFENTGASAATATIDSIEGLSYSNCNTGE